MEKKVCQVHINKRHWRYSSIHPQRFFIQSTKWWRCRDGTCLLFSKQHEP